MTNRFEIRANGEIIDTESSHRVVGAIERKEDGRRYLGDQEVTHIWNDPAKLNEAVESRYA